MGILKLIIAAIFILSGCAANPTEGMTPAEAKAYELKAEHERADKLILKHEAILSARANCKADHMVWVIQDIGYFDRRRMERDSTWLPKYVSMLDFACITNGEFRRILRDIS